MDYVAVPHQPVYIRTLVCKGVGVADVNRRLPPINQLLAPVLVCGVELFLRPQPKLVTVKKLKAALHIVENGVVDVLQ